MGALDKKLRDRMQLEVTDILERVGVTCVMVTHDQEEAMTMAGRIAIMNRGKFVQIGEPEEIYEHPNSRFSAEFIGSVNVFDCVLQERHDDALILQSPGLRHAIKVDPDASVVDGVPIRWRCGRRRSCCANRCRQTAATLRWGSGAHCLPGRSVHLSREAAQRADYQRPAAKRPPFPQGDADWGDEVRLCWETDSCVVLTV